MSDPSDPSNWSRLRESFVAQGKSEKEIESLQNAYALGVLTTISLVNRLPRGEYGLSRDVLFSALNKWNVEALVLLGVDVVLPK